MKKKRFLSILLVITLILTCFPEELGKKAGIVDEVKAEKVSPQNPIIEPDETMVAKQKVTYDCVWFGSYPQTEIVDQASTCGVYGKVWAETSDYEENPSLYATLKSTSGWDNNGDVTISGVKYRRIKSGDATKTTSSDEYYEWDSMDTYHYFRYEPIKWRVLNVNSSGSQAFLLTNIALDDQRYNSTNIDITWKTSTLRSWLNGYSLSTNTEGIDYTHKNFINCAFSPSERGAIESTYLDNKYSGPYSESHGGDDTTDKIFLPSSYDIHNTTASSSYGFAYDNGISDEARRCKASTYAKAMGTQVNKNTGFLGNCYWWLRSPGENANYAVYVAYAGYARFGDTVNYRTDGVRPALKLNLSSTDLYSYAGTVCTDGTVNEIAYSPDEGSGDSSENTTETKPDTTPSVPSVPTVIPDEITPSNPVALASVDKQITTAKSDTDPKGSLFNLLQAKGVAKSKTSVKISWKRVSGANAYIIYGNKCGAGNQFKKITTVTGTSFTQKKLMKGTYYKYLIVAANGDKALSTSKTIHVATKGGKVGNSKNVTTKAKKNKVSLNKGKTFKLGAKAIAQSKKLKVKKHRAIAYESSNKSIATVSGKGVIKAVGKGTCYVYAYAQNGVCKKVKITVK